VCGCIRLICWCSDESHGDYSTDPVARSRRPRTMCSALVVDCTCKTRRQPPTRSPSSATLSRVRRWCWPSWQNLRRWTCQRRGTDPAPSCESCYQTHRRRDATAAWMVRPLHRSDSTFHLSWRRPASHAGELSQSASNLRWQQLDDQLNNINAQHLISASHYV